MANSVFIGGTFPPGQIDGAGNFTSTGNFFVPTTRGIGITSRFSMFSSVNGTIEFYNSGGSDFSLVKFGGLTSAFPAIGRSTVVPAAVAARVADDSADAQVLGLVFSGSLAAPAFRSRTTLTNGAGASAGTLTNAPAAGNPTKWIAIDDNGTTRQIPAW